jgi:hypothetical protein
MADQPRFHQSVRVRTERQFTMTIRQSAGIGRSSGKTRLACLFIIFIKDGDALPPGRFLRVIDPAKIKHLPLRRLAAIKPARLDH